MPNGELTGGRRDQSRHNEGRIMNAFAGIGIAAILAVPVVIGMAVGGKADHPEAEISNGQIRAKIFLPETTKGFYLGTRFDWAGIVHSLEYQGHNYYGQWYT